MAERDTLTGIGSRQCFVFAVSVAKDSLMVEMIANTLALVQAGIMMESDAGGDNSTRIDTPLVESLHSGNVAPHRYVDVVNTLRGT